MNYMNDVEYERLLMEQSIAKQEVDTFAQILSVSEGKLESLNEAAMSRKAVYEKGKKLIDELMNRYKIKKVPYHGSENKENFLKGTENTCFLYILDDNEFRNKVIAFALLNPIISVAIASATDVLYANKSTLSMKKAISFYNGRNPNPDFALQSQITPKGRLVGFRAKDTSNNSIVGSIGRTLTGRTESVTPLELKDLEAKIKAIREADEEATKSTFEKFTNLIKTMVGKFTTYSEKQILKHKPFLTDMKDKILAKVNGESIPIEMRNYSAGINNIKNFTLPTFDSVKDKVKNPGDKNECEKEMRALLLPKYNDPSKDFKDFAKAYFQGGDAKIKTNINALNFMDIYNYCDKFQDIEKAITADADILAKINVNANQIAQQQSQEKQQENQEKQQAQQQQQAAKQEGATVISIEDRSKMVMSFLREEFSINEDDAPQQQAQPNQQKADDGKMTIGQNQNTQNGNQQDAQKSSSEDTKESTKELNVLTAYKTVGMQLIAAQMQSANIIYNDYVSIMKARVDNMGSKDTNAQPQPSQQTQQSNG